MKYKYKVIFGVPLIIIFIWVSVFADYSNPRRSICFRYGPELSLPYILGYLPKSYSEFCSESILDADEEYKLILVDRRTYEITPDRYVLLESNIGKVKTKVLFDKDKLGTQYGRDTNVLSPLIVISVFNEYIKLSGVEGKEEIKRKLFRILQNVNPKDFTVVESAEMLENLKRLKGIEDGSIEYEVLVEDFQPDFENYDYLWFDFYGMFELKVTIHENMLIDLEDSYIYDTMYLTI